MFHLSWLKSSEQFNLAAPRGRAFTREGKMRAEMTEGKGRQAQRSRTVTGWEVRSALGTDAPGQNTSYQYRWFSVTFLYKILSGHLEGMKYSWKIMLSKCHHLHSNSPVISNSIILYLRLCLFRECTKMWILPTYIFPVYFLLLHNRLPKLAFKYPQLKVIADSF